LFDIIIIIPAINAEIIRNTINIIIILKKFELMFFISSPIIYKV